VIYYRLRIVDIDGKFRYSKVIQISSSGADAMNFVRPSVIENKVIEIVVQGNYDRIQMINMQGKEVWRQDMHGRTGSMRYSLPSLMPGNYLVRLVSSGKVISQKVIIR
jgi:hypothetical protein